MSAHATRRIAAVMFAATLLGGRHISAGGQGTGNSLALIFHDGHGRTMPYRLFPPTDPLPGQRYPLVMFLHGSGAEGTDNVSQLSVIGGLITHVEQPQYQSFVLAPQTAVDDWTGMSGTLALEILRSVEDQYEIDPSRLYLTGWSLGGFGTWSLIEQHPNLFAAAVPISGGGNAALAARIKGVPIWAFHGKSDDQVPVSESRQMIAAITKAGGHPLYTEFPDGHQIADYVYSDVFDSPYDHLYPWMFRQSLSTPEPNAMALILMVPIGLLAVRRCRHSVRILRTASVVP